MKYYGLDLGNSNTVVSSYDVDTKISLPITLPGLSYGEEPNSFGYPGYLIPTVVAMNKDGEYFCGKSALQQHNLPLDRDLKKDVYKGNYDSASPFARPDQAPYLLRLFLRKVIVALATSAGHPIKLRVSYPVHSSKMDRTVYKDLLKEMLNNLPVLDIEVVGLCDEPYAAAVGYGVARDDSSPLVFVFDFGSSTVNTVILVSGPRQEDDRIIASRTELFGGRWIDEFLLNYINREHFADKIISNSQEYKALLDKCEQAKVSLSNHHELSVSFGDKTITLDKLQFDIEVLKKNEVDTKIQKILQLTLDQAIAKGWEKSQIKHVIVTGGGSLLSGIRDQIQVELDKEGNKILFNEPFAAVANGLAIVASGQTARKEIRNDVFVGSYNPETKSTHWLYRLCVAGDVFPSVKKRAFFIEPANWKEEQKPQDEMELQFYYESHKPPEQKIKQDGGRHLVERMDQHEYLGQALRLYAPNAKKLVAEFWVDLNGMLCLSVVNTETGEFAKVVKGLVHNEDAKELHLLQLD